MPIALLMYTFLQQVCYPHLVESSSQLENDDSVSDVGQCPTSTDILVHSPKDYLDDSLASNFGDLDISPIHHSSPIKSKLAFYLVYIILWKYRYYT